MRKWSPAARPGRQRTNARRAAALLACAVLGLAAAIGLSGCEAGAGTEEAGGVELMVSAAASLAKPLEELRRQYEERTDGIRLRINYGSSGTLQKQIEQGAPADVFVSAGQKQMDALAQAGLIAPSLCAPLLTNRLVIVVPAAGGGELASLADLAGEGWGTVAIGEPETVPAGAYAKEALERAGLWDALAGKLLFAKDVRQALAAASTGNADAAFVYATDAASAGGVRAAHELPQDAHAAIEYPAGVVAGSKHPREAEAFYRFLFSEQAADVFRSFGFGVAGKGGPP